MALSMSMARLFLLEVLYLYLEHGSLQELGQRLFLLEVLKLYLEYGSLHKFGQPLPVGGIEVVPGTWLSPLAWPASSCWRY